jgi:fructokinase
VTRPAPLVVGIGEVLWDKFPDGNRLGGAPANFAYHAGQLGARAKLVSRVGLDSDGDELMQGLRAVGVDRRDLQKDAQHSTGEVRVKLDEGQATYEIVKNAAWDFLAWTEDMAALATMTKALSYGTLAQRNDCSRITIQRFVRAAPIDSLRLFDINLRQNFYNRDIVEFGLDHATVLKANAAELGAIAEMFHWGGAKEEQVVELLFKHHPLKYIAVTHGGDGCHLYHGTERIVSQAPTVTVADTVGSGDAFGAALVMGLLRGDPLQTVADRANEVGAFVASQPGGMPKLPAALHSNRNGVSGRLRLG